MTVHFQVTNGKRTGGAHNSSFLAFSNPVSQLLRSQAAFNMADKRLQ